MAAIYSFLLNVEPVHLFAMDNHPQVHESMFYFCFSVFFFTFFLFVFSYSVYKRFKKTEQKLEEEHIQEPIQNDPLRLERSSAETVGKAHETRENDPTHMTHSLLLEILPSDSPKWECLFGEENSGNPDPNGSGSVGNGVELVEDQRVKKKKKRAKKKKSNLQAEEVSEERSVERKNSDSGYQVKNDLVCLYPFTSSSSCMQRRIKQQYDELVKCNETSGLTLAQVFFFNFCTTCSYKFDFLIFI